jgi:hypothetical protein
MPFLAKLQKLPESKRKIILWAIMILVAILLFFFWIKSSQERMRSFRQQEFIEKLQVPDFKKELKQMPQSEMPKIEVPELSEEELKQLEEMMKETEQGSGMTNSQ